MIPKWMKTGHSFALLLGKYRKENLS